MKKGRSQEDKEERTGYAHFLSFSLSLSRKAVWWWVIVCALKDAREKETKAVGVRSFPNEQKAASRYKVTERRVRVRDF